MGLLSDAFDFVGDVFSSVLDFALGWLIPDVPGKEGLKIERQGSDQAIPVIYGTQKVGGIKVHKYVTDTPQEAKNDLLHLIVVFSEGECDEIEEIFFNDIGENDKQWDGGRLGGTSFNVGALNIPLGGKWHAIQKFTGAEGQPASAAAVSGIPNWTIDHRLDGLCYAYIVLQMDEERSVWQGEPSITARIRGRKVLDTRTNTVEYSENPALCLRDYLVNSRFGAGLAESRIINSSFNSVADACDEGVESTITKTTYINLGNEGGGPEYVPVTTTETEILPRFSVNLVVDTGQSLFNNVRELLSSFRGIMPMTAEPIKLGFEGEGSPQFTFDDDNIVGDVSFSSGEINDRYNRVEIRFPNKTKNYENDSVFFPDNDSALYTQWLEEDGQIALDGSFEFTGINSKAEAIQMAEIVAKKSRFTKSLTLTALPISIKVEAGDIVGVSLDGFGWTNKPFRVTSKKLTETDDVEFQLTEHENAVYPWSGATFDDLEGGSWLGDPFNLAAPDNLTITPDTTLTKTGVFSWDYEADAFVREFQVRVTRKDSGDVVYNARVQGETWAIPLLDAGDYDFEVRAIGNTGAASGWSLINILLAQPVPPTSIDLIPRDWEIEARPQLSGIGLGTVFEFDIIAGDGTGHTPTSQGRATTYTFTGLLPDSQYTVFARTVNAYGESAWSSATATTTNVGAQVEPFTDAIKSELDAVELRVDDIDTSITLIDSEFDTVNSLISGINTDIDAIEASRDNINYQVQIDAFNREDSDAALLSSVARNAASREDLRGRIERDEALIDAVVYVDATTGTIVNRAFSYTDEQFNNAQLVIDGVDARVTATVESISLLDGEVNYLSAQLELVPGQITASATAIVAEAISALEPAHAFNFFNSAQGWQAVNGTLSSSTSNQIDVTWGDIRNNGLDYLADENRVMRLTIERTGGTGWTGDVIITRDDNSTETFSGIISDVAAGGEIVRSIDFRGVTAYSGTINKVRLVLGASVADTFTIKQIVIGKPDALLQEIEDVTARVTQAELDISANDAAITQRVTVTDYNANTVTFSNAETVVNGLDSVIELSATRQQLINDDTISKANSAAVTIDGYVGTITSLAQLVEDNQNDNTQTFTTVQQDIDATNGRITNQAFSIQQNGNEAQSALVEQLRSETAVALYRAGALDKDTNFALAISDLQVDVSPQGSLAKTIDALEAVTVSQGNSISATNTRLNSAETDIAGNATAISQIDLRVGNTESGLNGALSRIDSVEIDAGDNASAISALDLRVTNTESDITAAVGRIDSVEVDANNNATAISGVEGKLDDPVNNTSALFGFVQQAQTTADGNATAITQLDTRVTNAESDITSQATLIQSVKVTAEDAESEAASNATAITNLTTRVSDTESDITAQATLIQNAQIDANDNATAITQLDNRVTDNESFATAQIQLNSGYNADLGTLFSRAALVTDVNDRITGVIIDDNGVERVIEFISDSVRFVDGNGQLKIYYDLVNQRYVFDGEVNASSGTFTGTVAGASIEGGNIDIGMGQFTVNSSGKLTAQNATITGGLKTGTGTGNRVEIGTDSTYDIWVGQGAKTDLNGSFWVKPDGTGFIKGEFFEGEIIETRTASAQGVTLPLTATINNHNSAGKPVTISFKGSVQVSKDGGNFTNLSNNLAMRLTVKRGSTTLETISVTPSYLEYINEPEINENKTIFRFNLIDFTIDDITSTGIRSYSVTADFINNSGASVSIDTSRVIIKSEENKLA